jgi:hypothetical protein
MKKFEKIFRIAVPQVSRFELTPYEEGGYHADIQVTGGSYDSSISFDITDYSECCNLLNFMSSYSSFFAVVLTTGGTKFFTTYSYVTSYLQ